MPIARRASPGTRLTRRARLPNYIGARVEEIGARLCNHCYTSPVTVAACLHWLSTCRDAFIFEDSVEDSPLRHELTHEKMQARNGWITVPDRPSLGVTLNEEFIRGYLVGIFFSGGRAPEYIRDDKDLIRITLVHFFEMNKPVASVCHGVEIPARAGCVKGRRMATVPKCQFDLEVCGGTFVNEPCVVDGNLVSARTYHDHGHYVGKWIALLKEARAAFEKAKH